MIDACRINTTTEIFNADNDVQIQQLDGIRGKNGNTGNKSNNCVNIYTKV